MQNNISISPAGIALLKCYESLGPHIVDNRAYPYTDAVGKITVGYGHLIQAGEDFSAGLSIPNEVDDLLLRDLEIYIDFVKDDLISIAKQSLSQNEIDALILLCFNCGETSLLQSIKSNIIQNDILGVGLVFPRYCKGNFKGKLPPGPISGLTFRRYSELLLFATGEVCRINSYQELFQYALPEIRSAYAKKNRICQLPYPENLPDRQLDLKPQE